MQYLPPANITGAGYSACFDLLVASNVFQNLTPNSAEALYYSACDFKEISAGRPYTKYVGTGKFMRRRGIGYLSTNDLDPALPIANTSFKLRTAGFASGTVVGYLAVTYYVRFKSASFE